jgi:glycosyltransferase involved in cell wall biosynthesis
MNKLKVKNKILPLVSIIIPSYNHGKFIGRALDSVLYQTYKYFEVIIVDNYSNDETDFVISQYFDPRIRLFKIKNNGILGASRNLGIHAAKGDWLAFLDSDDWWKSEKLERCISKITNSVDLIYHDLAIVDQVKNNQYPKVVRTRQLIKPVLVDLLINGNLISNSSAMVRKSILDKIGPINQELEINPSVDYNTWLKVSKETNNFLFIPECLGYYQLHENNISKRDMSKSHVAAQKNFLEILNESQKKQVNSLVSYMAGTYLYLIKDFSGAIKKFLHTIFFSNNIRLIFKSLIMVLSSFMFLMGKTFIK